MCGAHSLVQGMSPHWLARMEEGRFPSRESRDIPPPPFGPGTWLSAFRGPNPTLGPGEAERTEGRSLAPHIAGWRERGGEESSVLGWLKDGAEIPFPLSAPQSR